MPKSVFPCSSLSLATLFERANSISVPAFQRPYCWTTREAGQLLEDLAEAAGADEELDDRHDYFLGTILLLCPQPARLLTDADSAPGTRETCQIIDGQQRLVTLTILAAVLRDLDEAPASPQRERLEELIGGPSETGSQAHYKMRLNDREQSFLVDFVLARRACAEMPADETQLTPAESAMLATREHFMSELSQTPAAERQRLARYLLDHCHLVVIATNGIDRAHRMFVVLNGRGLPLRREDILKAEIAQTLPRARSEDVLRRWDSVSLRLGAHFETLFGHIRSTHGDTRPQIIAAIRNIIRKRGGAEAFVTEDLEPLGAALATITAPWDDASDLDMDVRRRLVYLNRLNGSEWMPAAMMALRLHGRDRLRASTLIAGIDRLAHAMRIMCLGLNKRTQRFKAVMSAIEDGSTLTPWDGPFALSREDLRILNFNLRDLHVRAPSVCKSLLLRLDDEITGLLPSYQPADFSVEHVLPLRPPATSAWRRAFSDANVRSACTHSLGNLTLVTHKQNDRARNEDFERKRSIYMSPEIGRPVLTITREVIDHEHWEVADIEAREARLLALVARTWQLPAQTPTATALTSAHPDPNRPQQGASTAAGSDG